MATITEVLVQEHLFLSQMFGQIEGFLTGSPSAKEVKKLALLAESLLSNHRENENRLAYSVIDHVLAERGAAHPAFQAGNTIDGHFALIHRTSDAAEASRLLNKALSATRKQFRHEEQNLHPILEKTLKPETLLLLGRQWRKWKFVP